MTKLRVTKPGECFAAGRRMWLMDGSQGKRLKYQKKTGEISSQGTYNKLGKKRETP